MLEAVEGLVMPVKGGALQGLGKGRMEVRKVLTSDNLVFCTNARPRHYCQQHGQESSSRPACELASCRKSCTEADLRMIP